MNQQKMALGFFGVVFAAIWIAIVVSGFAVIWHFVAKFW